MLARNILKVNDFLICHFSRDDTEPLPIRRSKDGWIPTRAARYGYRLRVTSGRLSFTRCPVRHQRIARKCFVDHLAGRLDAGHRQPGRIEQADLHEDGCLVPIDMFVVELVAAKADHGEHRYFEVFPGWPQTRQKPVDLAIMRRAEHKLVDDTIGADRA